jgi:hypothetical protein
MDLRCLFSDKASKRQNTPRINQNLGHPPQIYIFNSGTGKKYPKLTDFASKVIPIKNQCNAMFLMMKNNLLVKKGLLLYIRRAEILKYQISIFDSALSVSAQS